MKRPTTFAQGRCAALLVLVLALIPLLALAQSPSLQPEFRIGWIGAMTGRVGKYGAWDAAQLATDDINAAGGIRGKKLVLLGEDGRCESATAISAMQKLIQLDKMQFVLGGHCSSETLVIAPLAERNKVLMLASITTSPALSSAGDYVFRVSPVSTAGAKLVAEYAYRRIGLRTVAVFNEETEYARACAEGFEQTFRSLGGKVFLSESFDSKETDFRSALTKVKNKNPAGFYLAVQSADTARMMLRQMKESGLKVPILGNESVGSSALAEASTTELFSGVIYGEPDWDIEDPAIKGFVKRYCERFKCEALPYGIWTAEAYDSVRLLAKMLNECGEDVEAVKKCLYQVKDYQGVSGKISIDQNGDGIKKYILKRVEKGIGVKIQE